MLHLTLEAVLPFSSAGLGFGWLDMERSPLLPSVRRNGELKAAAGYFFK